MKIAVIGGSGFIGSKLVPRLRQRGHDAVAASPNSGVNSVTGGGAGRSSERCLHGGRRIERSQLGSFGSTEFL